MAIGSGTALCLGSDSKISSLNTELLHKLYLKKQNGADMNRKIMKRICCIALIGGFLWAMQLFCDTFEKEGGFNGVQGESVAAESWKGMWKKFVGNGEQNEKPVVVIDAGHGGIDPGKVGVSGALEKDINLAIAKEIKELLEQNDIAVVLTRTDENGLYSETDRNKKSADMRERIRLLTDAAPVLAVSIHQNSFTDSASRGAQVFYYEGSQEGKRGAELIQETVKNEIMDGNHRLAKANSSYYMLKKSPCPLVIVECGFLSNPQEEKLLMTQEYQRKMAWAVHLGILKWMAQMQNERK